MKIIFMEEIEDKHAWRECMFCRRCDSYHYKIHHQTEPETDKGWWLECCNCGRVTAPAPDRKTAIQRWKNNLC